MARGWESKSVEAQQSEAADRQPSPKVHLSKEDIAKNKQKEGLLLSRSRVVQQLRDANNPQHRTMLQAALADLDSKLAQLG